MRLKLVTVLAAIVLLIGVSTAMADTITYTLNYGNYGINSYPGPYATVTVNLTSSTTATIDFDSLINGNYVYMFGANSALDVNVNATSWTLGSISASNSYGGFTPGSFTDGGSSNADGFGAFNQTIDSTDGYHAAATQASFSLTNTSGTWADAASVLTPNSNGYAAAAHIFVADCTETTCADSALATGYATVPEPASMALLGSGFLALGGFIRRRLTR